MGLGNGCEGTEVSVDLVDVVELHAKANDVAEELGESEAAEANKHVGHASSHLRLELLRDGVQQCSPRGPPALVAHLHCSGILEDCDLHVALPLGPQCPEAKQLGKREGPMPKVTHALQVGIVQAGLDIDMLVDEGDWRALNSVQVKLPRAVRHLRGPGHSVEVVCEGPRLQDHLVHCLVDLINLRHLGRN